MQPPELENIPLNPMFMDGKPCIRFRRRWRKLPVDQRGRETLLPAVRRLCSEARKSVRSLPSQIPHQNLGSHPHRSDVTSQ
jgi:hypothetical protein